MITDGEFQRIVTYVKRNYGIDLSQKKVMVAGRLDNYLACNGYANYDAFMTEVERNPRGGQATDLVNILTTNHTYFMRESDHFDFMKNVALPWAKDTTMHTKDLRIWCGASSTGEEPYTLAMVIRDFFGLEYDAWDTRILATDISQRVLEHAARGVYLKENIDPLPDSWKRRYFEQVSPEEVRVKEELRKEVIYRQFNLMDPITFKKKFHIVFLRNVMIYFEDETRCELIHRIYEHMEPGGYLFIGLTEKLEDQLIEFHYVQPSIYRK